MAASDFFNAVFIPVEAPWDAPGEAGTFLRLADISCITLVYEDADINRLSPVGISVLFRSGEKEWFRLAHPGKWMAEYRKLIQKGP